MHTPGNTIAFTPDDFTIVTLEDEIRADRLCTELLKGFAAAQVATGHLTPLEAGQLAHGADPFLRDFMIADRRENIFAPRPGRVRQYAGHFYIVSTMEPNRKELAMMLDGIRSFYLYAQEHGWATEECCTSIAEECSELDAYAARIESFWALEGDGFIGWRQELPLD